MMNSLLRFVAFVAIVFAFGQGVESARFKKPRGVVLDGYDYIVVGSGPGGAPLASRLGLAGYNVLVIEAGSDIAATDWNITVPMFNSKAAEDTKIAWNFYVNHYPHMSQDQTDAKFTYANPDGSLYTGLTPPANATPKGLLYPRSAAIGGCVNHNALIMMYPLEQDWSDLVTITGDSSWSAAKMRAYFQKVEQCQYMPRGSAGHGFDGWLPTNRADESMFLVDPQVGKMLGAALAVSDRTVGSKGNLTTSLLRDMNAVQDYETHQGLYNTPLNMNQYQRSSPRDFLVSTALYLSTKTGGGKIDIRTNCLVTRVLFKPKTTRVIGVEFMDGQSMYRADPRAPGVADGALGTALAGKEVIISAGTFNTPQLLKLSGIGPAAELTKLGIPVVVDLPGVGQNLQDRYENSIIVNLPNPFTVWKNCTNGATAADPCLVDWNAAKNNISRYSTNGRPVSIPKRAAGALAAANDMVVTGRPGYFGGYFEGYSKIGSKYPNSWTWPVLKARTQNRGGNITLITSNPRDTPTINFNYFDSGTGNWSYDLAATVEGMQFARTIVQQYRNATNETVTEIIPGPGYESEAKLTEWVKGTSWGHHACCTAKIGADSDPLAVLDSKFRVRGTTRLRVVDASVFPSIPGYYIQTPIYMISEKAAAVIIG